MSESQPEASSTRERLLEAAWTVIRDHGLRAATSRAITARAHANLGAITYYFGSKSTLIAAAAVSQMAAWTEPLSAALAQDEADGGGRTLSLIPSLLGGLDNAKPDVRALLELVAAPDVDPAVRSALREHLTQFQAFVADLMSRRQQRGELPDSVDPAAMSGFFTAIALGLMAQDHIGANPATVPAMVSELLALLEAASRRTEPSE